MHFYFQTGTESKKHYFCTMKNNNNVTSQWTACVNMEMPILTGFYRPAEEDIVDPGTLEPEEGDGKNVTTSSITKAPPRIGLYGLWSRKANTGAEGIYFVYHPDHLGSSSWVTDYEGKQLDYKEYLPFGELRYSSRTTLLSNYTRYTFSGKERDSESGYSYFGARYYDSDLSIWLSVDPMSDKYPSLTPYNYSANNPIRLIDPNGMEIEDGVGDPPFTGMITTQSVKEYFKPDPSKVAETASEASTVGTVLSTGSVTMGVTGAIAEKSDATFRVTNSKGKLDPKLYSNGWKGNQYVRPNSISKIGKGIKWGGNILSFASAGFSFYQISSENTTLKNVEHGVDGGISIIGTINPYTFAASLYYQHVMKNYPAIQQSVNQQSSERANMMKNGFIPVGHPGFPFK